MEELTPEQIKSLEKKQKEIKEKLDILQKKILKNYKKETLGLALLPPKKEEKDKINVLVVLDDSKSEHTPDFRLKDKISPELIKLAKLVDEKLWLEIMTVNEIKESFFDGKYEILQLVAVSVILYDPMDFLGALKISEVHKSMTIKKFEKYIVSYVAAGSLFRGEKSNDIDVYVIVDDTDVKRMSRAELRDKLRGLILSMGFEAEAITGIKKQFHIQVYILTDFWESVKDAHPVIFTFLRDGVPIYDRGVFGPWRLLLKMGRIRPSPEAIDMFMETGDRLLDAAKGKLLMIVGQELYYAVLNPAQAALMLYGLSPPTPQETIKLLQEVFVKKEKILEQKYVDMLERIRLFFKDIEHGKVKSITGAEIDKLIGDSEEFLKRINTMFKQIERKREKETFEIINKEMNKLVAESISNLEAKPTNLEVGFRKFCLKEGLPEKLADDFKFFNKSYNDFKTKKLTKAESDAVKREARTFVRVLEDHIQRKKFLGVERAKIRFKHGNKMGEILLLNGVAFIVENVAAKEKDIKKATIVNGRLKDVKKSDIIEMDKYLIDTEIPKVLSVKESLFDDLKKIVGKEIEIIF
ncbi:hypothetical protein J4438_00815 [Candidatus Woesearchaeota archaeon]|nr:hypothetical protein [Candidatus Woesearchaeota archaeon]